MKNTADVIIIGAGMAGMSTAYSLIGQVDTLFICEQYSPAHQSSSSYGETRLYRRMYSDPWLAQLANHSNQLWAQMEAETDLPLRKQTGLLFFGEDWGEETVEGSILGSKKVMQDQNIPFQEFSNKEIEHDFPLKAASDWIGLLEKEAGVLLLPNIFHFWIDKIQKAGFSLKSNTPVLNFQDNGKEVSVKLTDGTEICTRKLILTAGPWTRQFLPPRAIDYEIWQMTWAHYSIEEELVDQYPIWYNFQQKPSDDLNQGLFYGFPCLHRTAEGVPYIKAGIDWASQDLKSTHVGKQKAQIPSNQLLQVLDDYLFSNVNGIKKRIETHLSPYTMSSDVQFCLDKLSPNVSIFSHGSGRAFKFAPFIGNCLAALTLEAQTPFELTPWRISRLFN